MVKEIYLPSDVLGGGGGGPPQEIHALPQAFILFFLKILDRRLKFTIANTQMLVIVIKIWWKLMGSIDF